MPAPLFFVSPVAVPFRPVTVCAPHTSTASSAIHPGRRRGAVRTAVRASFMQDFLAGPSNPPRPRPLYQVILFTISTNFIWYGWYKYCIEQELRRLTGEGPGGIGALLPFILGVTSPLYLPSGLPSQLAVFSGILWIVSVQYYLYQRINSLIVEKGAPPPLTPWWIVVPGFNLVVGLRSVHFLSLAFGAEADSDPLIDYLPFLGKDTLGIWELLTTPSLWLSFGIRNGK